MNDWEREPGDLGPFARAAFAYRQLGWLGTIPLPARRKAPPPDDWTGWKAGDRYPSAADVQAWLDEGQGVGNIGLRMPDGVVGLDVDDYVKGEVTKTGLAAVHELEQAWGTLPPTWRSTSRRDGRSGIRFFRAPPGMRWPSKAAPSIEMIHKGHRYAVAAPSIHPDTGQPYVWISPDGQLDVEPPRVDQLPELPGLWINGLTQGEAASEYASTGVALEDYLASLRDGMSEPCPYVRQEQGGLAAAVTGTTGESRHDAVNQRVMAIVRAGQVGHVGVELVLRQAFAVWLGVMAGVRGDAEARGEWSRAVDGAVDKVGTREPGSRCLCRSDGDQEAQEAWLEGLAARQAAQPLPGAPDGAPGLQSTGDAWLDEAIRREAVRRAARRHVDVFETEAELAKADFGVEYLSRAQLASLPRPEPLIEGVLARTSTILLRGRDATFKSFVAIDWALSIATGQPWLNRDVERGRVLYVMGEGAPGMNDRVAAWEDYRDVRVPDDAFLVRVSPVNLYKGGAAYVDLLRRVEAGEFSLIVLDTLRKVSGGADGNGSDMGIVVDRIEELRRATADGGNGAVVTLAHTAKDDVDTRGYSGVEDDSDIVWHAIRKDEHSPQLALRNAKQKNARETDDIQIMMSPRLNSLVVTQLSAAGLAVVEPGAGKARRLWQALVDNNQTGITQPALRAKPYEFPKSTVSELLNKWIKDGRVVAKGYVYFADETQTPTFDDGLAASWGSAEEAPQW